MELFDLHCDTLYKATTENGSIINNDYHISIKKGQKYNKWFQTMAVWIPDEVKGQDAFKLFLNCCKKLKEDIIKSEYEINHIKNFSQLKGRSAKTNIILSVENGSALNGKIENIELFSKLGVRFMTLTWNGTNDIGDGAGVENPKGITPFGKKVIKEMEKRNITADISHAGDKLFWDVMEIASKPIIATHSNSRSICDHKRNLTDEQFTAIVNNKGIVGLNLHRYFIKESGEAVLQDILPHIEHFLSLGGEKTLALGTDFDGADMPYDVKGIENLSDFYELLLRKNYKEELIKDIFFRNAYKFCENFDN